MAKQQSTKSNLLTTKQATHRLGISRWTLRRMEKSGGIKPVRTGGKIGYRRIGVLRQPQQSAIAHNCEWLTVKEVSRFFGVCRMTIWRWVRSGRLQAIPTVRIGGSLRFSRTAIMQAMGMTAQAA